MLDPPDSPLPFMTPEETLLTSARTGDEIVASTVLGQMKAGEIELDVNCKGNHEWTPLHMACYFGRDKVASLLIKYGADINVINDTGDTPLHKAAYTSREELVLLLLSKNADVFVKNSEGQTPRDICNNEEVEKLLKGAETADIGKRNSALLQAAREGDVQSVENLLKSDNPPDINCVDSLGNSALHCASYRGKKEVAVLLLQNGIDSSIRNLRGQMAVDLALNLPMKQILGVQPVKHFQKNASRYEGLLLRKSRFLGWKEVWTILEKGVMSFFNSRADSTTGTRRKGYKYLDGAKILTDSSEIAVFTISFSDNTRQRFCLPKGEYEQNITEKQKWINALTEHIEFSSHYLKQGFSDSDPEEEDDLIPVGTMQDKLQTAQAHLQLFEKSIDNLKGLFDERCSPDNGGRSTFYTEVTWNSLSIHVENMVDSAQKASSSLAHCLTVFAQQEEVRQLQLRQEQERSRVLQDALHALAQEHHELEKSFVSPFHSPPNTPHCQDTDCDEFFDAFEGDYSISQSHDGDNDDTLSNSDTIVSEATGCFASISLSSSAITRTALPSKWGRSTLPVPQFSRNDFSIWSILKQCIGKELSKITMPVVFNEPLSFLQRLSENIEYFYLLDKANNTEDPVKRIEYVASFAVACISSNWERLGKPFNPLLGETYEIEKEGKFRIVTEQVSHHPPVTAFHGQSQNFTVTGAIHPKLKLWARSVEIKPEGTVTVKLLKRNEVYTWTGITCCVHNIIVGKLWMEQCGTMEIKCHSNNLSAELNFKPAGWYSRDLNCVEGYIVDSQGTKIRFIFGKWCSYLKSADPEYFEEYQQMKDKLHTSHSRSLSNEHTSNHLYSNLSDGGGSCSEDNSVTETYMTSHENSPHLLWEADPRPPNSSDYYNFTYYAMALNEPCDDVVCKVAPTDSRLRPDIRKLEEGDVDGAAYEKNRLEEKQREVRKIRKKDKTTWVPLWFESKPHPYAKEEAWFFKDTYWNRCYANCPDIF